MKLRETIILALGSAGFTSQIIIQFLGGEPSYLIMGGSLALLGVAPFLRIDEARRNDRERERDSPWGSER